MDYKKIEEVSNFIEILSKETPFRILSRKKHRIFLTQDKPREIVFFDSFTYRLNKERMVKIKGKECREILKHIENSGRINTF